MPLPSHSSRDSTLPRQMGDGSTLQEINAGANACSVEWCPIAGLEDYVACSTYLLESNQRASISDEASPAPSVPTGDAGREGDQASEEGTTEAGACVGQTRTGSIVAHRLVCSPPTSGDEEAAPSGRLEESARVSLDGGVLDAKWSQHALDNGSAVLACATSTGRLALYTLRDAGMGEEHVGLQQWASSDKGDNLLLSLDWSQGNVADAKIVVSQSDGGLATWRLHAAGGAPFQEVGPWPAHNLRGGVPTEAWIAFFRKGAEEDDASFVVSGADDGLMKGWDLRAGGACGALPAFVCKEHEAGVTAGQWHPTRQHIFVSGSYDERVRVWDARALRTPVSTVPTGGGLWRLKWHPHPDRGNLLLAACMHAGVRVLDMDTGLECHEVGATQEAGANLVGGREVGGSNEIVAEYTRHDSMAYGADWCRTPASLRSRCAIVSSCSFYDSLLCLWRTPPLWP